MGLEGIRETLIRVAQICLVAGRWFVIAAWGVVSWTVRIVGRIWLATLSRPSTIPFYKRAIIGGWILLLIAWSCT